jgi:hypothetical protein
LGRAFKIGFNLGSFCLKLLWEQRNGVADKNKRIRAIELRTIFTKLGPTFVKLGQGLSTRPDICPPEYLEELSELQVLKYSLLACFDLIGVFFLGSAITAELILICLYVLEYN